MKKILFLAFAAAIVIFSAISICVAPIISGILTESSSWKTYNIKGASDNIKASKDAGANDDDLKPLKKGKNLLSRKKAMYGLEYSSFIINLTLGFICAILGLLHLFDIAKYFEKISGIIGLATGIIGFIITLVYVCYSGYIFTHDNTDDYDGGYSGNNLYKLNENRAFAEWKDGKYKCLFYDKDDSSKSMVKYNELGKKQYNYDKDKSFADSNDEFYNCNLNVISTRISKCENEEYVYDNSLSPTTFLIRVPYVSSTSKNCDYLYKKPAEDYGNKYIYDRWVTTIIFACFIIACDLGLAIFGFLLFKNSNGAGI